MKTNAPTAIATALEEMGMQLVESPLQGRPRYLGKSADGHTQLELRGAKDALRGFTIVADVSPEHMEAARRNGALMSLFLDLAAPLWTGRHVWLVQSFARFDKLRPMLAKYANAKAPRIKATTGYATIELTFLHKVNQVVLTIQMRGQYATLSA